MYLTDLMNKKNMTRAELSRKSCVPATTLRNILNGHTQLDYCDAGTLYALGKTLNTSVEEILDHYWDESPMFKSCDIDGDARRIRDQGSLADFYHFTAVCTDLIEHKGEALFVKCVLKYNWINGFYENNDFRKALFLLGVVDYVYRKHGWLCLKEYGEIRYKCLDMPVYSLDTLAGFDHADISYEKAKKSAEEKAIPELRRFNIFMTEDDIRRKV